MTPRPPPDERLHFVHAEHEQPPARRQTRDVRRVRHDRHWSQRRRAFVDGHERLARLHAAHHVAEFGDEAKAVARREQQRLIHRCRVVMQQVRSRFEFDQRRDRHAVAASARQHRDRHRIHAPVAAPRDQHVGRARLERRVDAVAGLELEARRVEPVTLQRAHPALLRHDHRHRFVDHARLERRALFLLDQRAPVVAVLLRVGFDFLDEQALHRGVAVEQFFELGFLVAQFLQFLLDLDRLHPRQLTQTDVEDVVGLALGQAEPRDQRLLRIVGFADDADHFVDIQEDDHPPFENMDPVVDLAQAMLRAPRDRREAEADPLVQDLGQPFLARPAVGADHHEVDRRVRFEARMREQRIDELGLVDAARLRLEHEAHRRVLAGFVAHGVEEREQRLLGLQLVGRERLLAELDLRVRQFLDFLEHLLARRARRQFGDDELPLAAREVFDFPARAHLEAAAPRFIRRRDFRLRRDDLPAAREVRAGNPVHQRRVADLRIADHRDRRARDFAQVVRRNFRRKPDRDARRAVQQQERQARGQQLRLFERAVVVRHEIDGALVDFVEQQFRDRREARFGVAHRRCAVAVARAEIALAVDQRIAHREVLRETHERVIRRLVAVRMILAEHVADDARRLHRLRRIGEPHFVHREEDAALHGLLPVRHVGQRAAFHHAHRVVEVGRARRSRRASVARLRARLPDRRRDRL